MTDTPRPDVAVTTTEDGKTHVVISREGKGRSYDVEGATPNEKIKNGIEKVIGDAYSAEWLPRPK